MLSDARTRLCRQSFSQRRDLFLRARENIILRAGIRSLTKGEHHFVSLASDQDRVHRLHELRADLGNFFAPVKPVGAAVLAGDVVIETVGEAEGYFAHLLYCSEILCSDRQTKISNSIYNIRDSTIVVRCPRYGHADETTV